MKHKFPFHFLTKRYCQDITNDSKKKNDKTIIYNILLVNILTVYIKYNNCIRCIYNYYILLFIIYYLQIITLIFNNYSSTDI